MCTSYTLIGEVSGLCRARAAIHSPSAHSWRLAVTTEAVAGGVSASAAIGSALAFQCPSGPQISYLYLAPSTTPGTNSSHTPDPPSERIGCPRPSQWLKSPMTRTPRALGAHTANDVPDIFSKILLNGAGGRSVAAPNSLGCAPRTRHNSSCLPSPIRCRSTSPTVGWCRYGSSLICGAVPSPPG